MRLALRAALSAFALLPTVESPAAATLWDSHLGGRQDRCYARTYDAAHLRAHPKQRVTAIMIRTAKADKSDDNRPPKSFVLGFAFRLKGRDEVFSMSAGCAHHGPGISCSLEGDGGRFDLTPSGDALKLTGERIELEGERTVSPDLAKGGDDRVFILRPSPLATCEHIAR